jgi:hypothetical protein
MANPTAAHSVKSVGQYVTGIHQPTGVAIPAQNGLLRECRRRMSGPGTALRLSL